MSEDDTQSKSPKERMSRRDQLGLMFSLLALCLSFASFYYSNWKIDDETLMRVAQVSAEEDDTSGIVEEIVIVATMLNIGNRPSIITSAASGVSLTPSDRPVLHAIPDSPFPLLLAPREVKIVRVRIPVSQFTGRSKGQESETVEEGVTKVTRFGSLQIEAVDSLGQLHRTNTPALMAVKIGFGERDYLDNVTPTQLSETSRAITILE